MQFKNNNNKHLILNVNNILKEPLNIMINIDNTSIQVSIFLIETICK